MSAAAGFLFSYSWVDALGLLFAFAVCIPVEVVAFYQGMLEAGVILLLVSVGFLGCFIYSLQAYINNGDTYLRDEVLHLVSAGFPLPSEPSRDVVTIHVAAIEVCTLRSFPWPEIALRVITPDGKVWHLVSHRSQTRIDALGYQLRQALRLQDNPTEQLE